MLAKEYCAAAMFMIVLGFASSLDAQPLSVPVHPQETHLWCWAACGQMVMEFLGLASDEVRQCRQAERLFRRNDCCPQPQSLTTPPAECVREGWPDFPSFNISARCVRGALNPDELFSEVKLFRRPVIFSWKYTDLTEHALVIIDFFESGMFYFLTVVNPSQGVTGEVVYGDYVSLPGTYSASYAFYAIERTGPGAIAENCPKVEAPLEPDSSVFSSAREAAEKSLKRIVLDSDAQRLRTWGFKNKEEADAAVVGAPIQEFLADADAILMFQQNSSVGLTLRPSGRWTFPVLVNGKVVTSLRVREFGQNLWKLSTFGDRPMGPTTIGPGYIGRLVDMRENLLKKKIGKPEDFIEVLVPSFSQEFLALRNNKSVFLAPVLDDASENGYILRSAEETFSVIRFDAMRRDM